MRRRRQLGVDLFPFLSVLFCAIGVVIFVMSVLSLVSLNGPHDQRIVIAGTLDGRSPRYVECDSSAITIHPEGRRLGFDAGKAETGMDPMDSSELNELMDDLARPDSGDYLVLLVRPEGVPAFEHCRQVALERGLALGKDALLSGGRLVFTTADGRPVLEEQAR